MKIPWYQLSFGALLLALGMLLWPVSGYDERCGSAFTWITGNPDYDNTRRGAACQIVAGERRTKVFTVALIGFPAGILLGAKSPSGTEEETSSNPHYWDGINWRRRSDDVIVNLQGQPVQPAQNNMP